MSAFTCPYCKQRVALDAQNVMPTHDEAPPCRSLCPASGADATWFVDQLATASAEAALAERKHIASSLEAAAPFWDPSGANAVLSMVRGIRARTTPATLSTETLAAIAEARGLRVVEPELLEWLEPPVLRWGYTAAHESEANVSGWHLTASDRNWAIIHESGVKVLSPRPNRASETDNRLAAEAALRSLGVAFRVEDGGAK